MKRREPMLALLGAAAVVIALMAVFAVELSNTQAKSKRDVQARVHERAVLAAALMDSLFQTVQQGIPQDAKTYGAATVSSATMDRGQLRNAYVVLLDAGGRVIAHSRGFDAQASAALGSSAALALVRSGRPYGLGDLIRYGRTGAIEFAGGISDPVRAPRAADRVHAADA